MAVQRVAYTTGNTDNAASTAIDLPAGTQNGDLLVLLVSSDGTSVGTPPAGFTTAYSGTTGGSHQDAVHWKIADSEPTSYTITPSSATNERAWIALIAYRGVDQLSPIESVSNIVNPVADQNMDVPAVTSTEAGSLAVAFGGIESGNAGSPVGANFTNGYVVISDNEFGPPGTGNGSASGFFGEQDLLTAGTIPAGTVSFGGGNTHGQVIAFVVKAGDPPVIGVTDYETEVSLGDVATVTGFGFGATQGAGKVQYWSDIAGTIREDQVINSWSDTSITYDITKGALSDDSRVYLVIINNDGDQTFSLPTILGIAPYDVFLDDLNFDHLWSFDGVYTDAGKYPTKLTIGSQQTTGDGGNFVNTPIAEATTQCWRTLSARREPINSPVMNQFALTERWFGGWFQANDIFKGLVCIYEEGGGVNNVSFYLGLGNRLIASYADTGDDNAQAFSDFALVPGRAYHISWGFSYDKEPKEFRMWIDGVKQTVTSGNPLTSTNLDGHGGDISFGGAGGNLEVAGTDVLFRSCSDGQYAWWFSTRVIPTDEQILNVFRRGAVPTVIIGSDTSANMQAQLDAVANTVRPNAGLCIRVNEPTDGTSLSLNANNVVFVDEASVWVEWRGRGNLTWTNLNGSNLSLEKTYITKGGSINVVTPATLTLTGVAENSEVRVFEAGTQNEVAGQEVVTGGIFSATIQVPTVDIRLLRQGSQWLKLANIDTTVDTSLPVQQLLDRQFRND